MNGSALVDLYVLILYSIWICISLSCIAFEFTDILSLLTLEVYTIFELIHCIRVCRLPDTYPGNANPSR